MKKTLILILSLFAAKVYADDTADLQSMLNRGDVVLPANHAPYTITKINLVHSLNLNGNTINCTLPVGPAMVMRTPGTKLSNGEIVGPSDDVNPSGSSALEMNGDNETVDNMYIHHFSAYAIYGGDGNAPIVTNSKLTDIGYACIFFVSHKYSTQGGVIANVLFDRSMLDPQKVTEGAMMLRGGINMTEAHWRVHDNVFKMPLSPKDITSECFELRHAPNSVIYNNTCTGGSIGISVVGNDYVTVYNNKCTQQNQEGIEYANSSHGMIRDNIITDQLNLAVLIDGFAPESCQYDTLENNTMLRCGNHAVELFKDTHHIYFHNCTINTNKSAIYLHGAHDVDIKDCKFKGNGYGSTAVFLDNSAGNVHVRGGSLENFEHKLFIYGSKGETTTDNVKFDKVKSKNNIKEADKNIQNGASVGTNIRTHD